MTKISSPLAWGSGAFVAHKSLEARMGNYRVIPYNPYWTLFPPAIHMFSDRSADVIHAPVDYAIFSRQKSKPLVSTFHGFVLDPYIFKYVSLLRIIHYRTDLRWFILQALKKSDAITCVSAYLAGLIRENLNYKGDIRVIYNGVDEKKFIPVKKTGVKNAKIKVLYCGGARKGKGIDLIPDILDRTSDDIQLVYTSGLRSNNLAIRHPRADPVGKIDIDAMPQLYNEVDMLLFPSIREGFGLAVAEAMACGLPVITTDCSALPELVDDGRGGVLCPPGNIETFAEKINLLARSPGLRKEMGEYNRQKVEKYYTLERMAAEYNDLFEEVLS